MKKYLLGLFAIALAISFSAFETSRNFAQTKDSEGWFLTDVYGDILGPNQMGDGTECNSTGAWYCSKYCIMDIWGHIVPVSPEQARKFD